MGNVIVRPATLSNNCTKHESSVTVKIGEGTEMERCCDKFDAVFVPSYLGTETERRPDAHHFQIFPDRVLVVPFAGGGEGFADKTPRAWFKWRVKMLSGKGVTVGDIMAAGKDVIAEEFATSGAAPSSAKTSSKAGPVSVTRPIWRMNTELLEEFKQWVVSADLTISDGEENVIMENDDVTNVVAYVFGKFDRHIADEKTRFEESRKPQVVIANLASEVDRLRKLLEQAGVKA